MKKIRNYDQLISHGDIEARIKVLQLMDAVLQDVDAGKRIQEIMSLDGDILTIGERSWDISKKKNIYLIGAGKACNAMAQAVCDVMGERISRGIISVKVKEEHDHYFNTEVYVGGHPLPNEEGMKAARRMLELINQAGSDDLFISVFSGGSSALLTYPVNGITLEDEIATQDILLKSGAKIIEINAVRRHISRTNGGRLAEMICKEKGAELISIMVGDSVGQPPTSNRGKPVVFYGTPVAADDTTIQDARNMIVNYNLGKKLPKSVIDFIWDDDKVMETPKQFDDKLTTFLVGSLADSCESAIAAANNMGIPYIILTTFLEGESREAGQFLSSIAREVKTMKRPITPPCFVICAGETTTRIDSPPKGIGGPSQELVLGLSIGIRNFQCIAGASIDTEGTDGPTIYAGGIVDGSTIDRFEAVNINVYEALRTHVTGNALMSIGDNIFTGNTGTNLCDLNVIYIY
ncbi:MAG: DUF4147 domain-containing protein [Sedimentibacter sp.]|nr:DUF4147 domain-containing protein [Sedimentibacter sp.]